MSAIIASILVALCSLIGCVLLAFSNRTLKRFSLVLLCFATGTFIANLTFHLVPETFNIEFLHSNHIYINPSEHLLDNNIHKNFHEHNEHGLHQTTIPIILLILAGFIAFAIIDLLIKNLLNKKSEKSLKHLGLLNLYGDSLHNFTDGIILAMSFMVSPELGLSSTIMIIAHELPQETSDFAILLHSGFSKKKALWLNLLVGSSIILATALFLIFGKQMQSLTAYLSPIITGTYVYYLGFGLLPEAIKNTKRNNLWENLIASIIGVVLIFLLIYF